MADRLRIWVFCAIWCFLCTVVRVPGATADSQDDDPPSTYKMEVVMAVWRHGNRTSVFPYLTELIQDIQKTMPYGLGQLTPNGRRQSAILGKTLAARYSGFLPSFFSYNAAQITCTAYRRTQETSMVAMTYIWPPIGPQYWGDSPGDLGDLWTPIPCQYLPLLEDPVYNSPLFFCPRTIELALEIIASPSFLALQEEYLGYGAVNAYIALHKGPPIVSTLDAIVFYDDLVCQEGNGTKMEDWTKQVYPFPLRKLYGLFLNVFSWNKELQRLTIGQFLKLVLGVGTLVQQGVLSLANRVFYGYSLHDLQIAVILTALKLVPQDDRPTPPFASVFLIEWYRDSNTSQVGAKFLYQNETWNEPIPLRIPGCDVICPLDQIAQTIADVIPVLPYINYCQPLGTPVIGSKPALTAEHFEQYSTILQALYGPEVIPEFMEKANEYLHTGEFGHR